VIVFVGDRSLALSVEEPQEVAALVHDGVCRRERDGLGGPAQRGDDRGGPPRRGGRVILLLVDGLVDQGQVGQHEVVFGLLGDGAAAQQSQVQPDSEKRVFLTCFLRAPCPSNYGSPVAYRNLLILKVLRNCALPGEIIVGII
jgi:hypothetical protein